MGSVKTIRLGRPVVQMKHVVKILGGAGAGGIVGGLWAAVSGDRPVVATAVIITGCVLLAAAIVLSGRYPSNAAISADARQSNWARGLALMPIALVWISPVTGDALWKVASQQALEARWPLLIFVVWALGLVAQLAWGTPRGGLGDELIRTYLASALAWGFAVALTGMAVLGLLVVIGAQAVVTAVPVVFALVLWVVGLRLWLQVRDADRG